MMEATGNSESCERWRWRPASLDIFWLRDKSLEDSANLPEPSFIAAEIAENLEAALGQIRGILEDPGEK